MRTLKSCLFLAQGVTIELLTIAFLCCIVTSGPALADKVERPEKGCIETFIDDTSCTGSFLRVKMICVIPAKDHELACAPTTGVIKKTPSGKQPEGKVDKDTGKDNPAAQ